MLRHAGCRTSRLIAFCNVHGASSKRRHNERDGVSNHRRLDYFLNRFCRSSSKKTSKLRVTGLCEGNSPVTGEFPAQRASNTENVSIWWRHHITRVLVIWWYNIARHSMMELVTTFQHHGKYDCTIFLSIHILRMKLAVRIKGISFAHYGRTKLFADLKKKSAIHIHAYQRLFWL